MIKKLENDTNKHERHSSLREWIQSYPTRLAVYAPVFVALLVVAIGVLIGTEIYHSYPPAKFGDIVLFTAFLIAGLTGWIQIWLREAYGFVWPVRGRAAIIWGALWVAVCWGLAILLIWDVFAGPAQ